MTVGFEIAGRPIGAGAPPYIVAEMSGNHRGELARAKDLVRAAKAAGADAVKLQTYTAETLTIDHDGPGFVIDSGLWAGRRLFDLYREAATPWEWHQPLFALGREIGITVFSAPFDATAVDLLRGLDAPAYKIASPEIVDLPLIRRVAATGRPLIMSTGMAAWPEIEAAVGAARAAGARDLAVLHCVSAYPTPAAEAHLATLVDLAGRLDCVVGLSDHSTGTAVAVAAVALGARVVEKHFTLARADGGVDSAFSLEPAELADLVGACRDAAAAVGVAHDGPLAAEAEMVKLRRSLYVVAEVPAGAVLTADHVRSIRPGGGLPPAAIDQVLGRRAARDLAFGEPLDWTMVVGGAPVG